MDEYVRIRGADSDGMSIHAISREFGHSRNKLRFPHRSSGRAGNAVKDFVMDLAKDPRACVDERNSGEFHYGLEPRKFAALSPRQT